MENIVIGKEYVAELNAKNPWVRCEDGNNGEKDYYKDVFDNLGRLMYCDGEHMKVIEIDNDRKKVTLMNENNDIEEEYFEISVEQFIEDFMKGGK